MKNFEYKFKKPTILGFMGIPGSGKSTIAKKISALVDSECYLEYEEDFYPKDIQLKLLNPDQDENILDIHFYFRNMRYQFHNLSFQNKLNNKSTIIDSFFSKLMLDILNQKNPSTDWFINSKNIHFPKILDQSKKDSISIVDADLIIFLHVSKEIHKQFLKKRNRSAEVNENIYQSQQVFLKASQNYINSNQKKFILINQENNLDKIVNSIIEELLEKNIIEKI